MITAIFSSLIMFPIYLGWIVCILAVPVVLLLPIIGVFLLLGFHIFETNKLFEHGDRFVRNTIIIEDGSEIVSFAERFPNLHSYSACGRVKVGALLAQADQLLPFGYHLKIIEGYRSCEQQRNLEIAFGNRLRKIDAQVPEGFIEDQLNKMHRDFSINGHNTGGAVDITLMDDWGNEMDLGEKSICNLNWRGKAIPFMTSRLSKKNRNILTEVMKKAGFVPYEKEWWHWSFGDQYWCASTGAKSAIFGRV
jgi:D-alanyl-D-alanine dipeptidase